MKARFVQCLERSFFSLLTSSFRKIQLRKICLSIGSQTNREVRVSLHAFNLRFYTGSTFYLQQVSKKLGRDIFVLGYPSFYYCCRSCHRNCYSFEIQVSSTINNCFKTEIAFVTTAGKARQDCRSRIRQFAACQRLDYKLSRNFIATTNSCPTPHSSQQITRKYARWDIFSAKAYAQRSLSSPPR